MAETKNRPDVDLEGYDPDIETTELDPEQVERLQAAGKAAGEVSEDELEEILETPEFQYVDRTREIDLRDVEKRKKT